MHRIEDSERTTDVRVEEKHYTYDANGNVVQERLRGSGTEAGIAQSVRERITDIAYAVSASRYLLGRPSHTTLRDPSGFLLAEKRFYYDGPDFVGLPLGQMERGLVSRVEEWVLTQADFDAHYAGLDQNVLGYTSDVNAEGVASVFAVRELTRYDGRGLAIAKRDPFGNETTMGYDLDGVFRLRLTDPLGESEFEYDRSTGQINRITYPDGAVGQFKYDAQGRLLHGLAPGEDPAKPATTHTYDESVIPNRRTVGLRQLDGTISNSVTYYDGYGKPFQQRAEVEPGHYVVSGWRRLNPWGDLKEEFEPTFADTAEFGPVETLGRPSRQIFYDARGRTVRCLNYNRGESTVSFEPFRVTTRDANDHDASPANVARGQFDTPHVEEFDVFRYLRRVTERVGVNRHVATAYEIGPMGELLAVSDTRGEKFRYRYDRLGNRLELTLREAGTRKLWYDAAKRLIRSLDGEGHDLRAQWDAIGRLQSLRSGAELLEEYTYDDGAQNAFGLLAAVQYPGGRQVFHYDEQRRLVRREHHHEGFATPVAIEHEYDPLGREIACTYDDQTRIEKRFSLNGWLVEIPGVITRVERDARGLPIEIKFANGVRTQCEYTAGPGRLRRQQTQGPNAEMLEDRLFALDQMEMILSSDDPSAGGSGPRSYAYDPLYQLTRVSSVENGLPVQRTYDYVNDYNLSRFDEARATLHYDDPQRPERLTSLTAEGGAQFDVDYDGDGNLLALPNQQFVYNAKNELFSFIRSDGLRADYRYDHHGLRVSKRVEGAGEGPEVIRYLGLGGEVQSRGDGSNELICHVRVGDRRVATLRAGAALFVHEDGLGSTAFVTDASGQVSGRVDHLPFGTVAGSVGTVEFRTYGLHPLDAESGLVYMRRRYYSPALGRFLTPDLMAIYQPEQLMHHPQHLHLYSYVANDPLNKTDPTGLSVWSVIGMVVGIAAGIAVGAALVALSGGLIGAFGIIGLLMASGIILGVSLGVAAICYTIAANLDSGSGAQEFFRGFMIGFNAGMNAAIASALFCPYAGIALGIIGAAAAIDRVASNHVYQGVLGWSSWAMPMSWTMTGLGVIAYVINGFAALISWNGDWWLSGAKIEDVSLDWRTGTFVMSGGLTSPSPSSRANGYNLGNFVILNPGLSDAEVEVVMRHETGHTLNTGAFGSGFELLTLIDEVVVNAGHEQDAYGEMIAESIVPGTDRPTIPMWS
ncbi:MAG: RHS repeat-associated core domain-containing protein [Verrucomicrobiota bacterium]